MNRKKIENFRDKLISISVVGNRIFCKFPCVLCEKMFTAQSMQKNDQHYWILSNYSLYVQKHLKTPKPNECDSSNEYIEEDGEIIYLEKIEDRDISNEIYDSIAVIHDKNELNVDHSNDNNLSYEEYVSEIYNQISTQIIRMNTACLRFGESELDMAFDLSM